MEISETGPVVGIEAFRSLIGDESTDTVKVWTVAGPPDTVEGVPYVEMHRNTLEFRQVGISPTLTTPMFLVGADVSGTGYVWIPVTSIAMISEV